MKTKRIVCLIIAVVMIISALSACSLGSASVPFSVDEEGRFVYVITRSADSHTTVESAIKDLRKAIKENFGVNITILKDTVKEADNSYEILIGNTNREESAEALEILSGNRINNKNDFIVKVIGKKIVIQALSDENIVYATQWFINTFCQSEETWKLLRKDYQFIYEHKAAEIKGTNTVNGVDLGDFKVVTPLIASYFVGMGAEELSDFYGDYGFKIEHLNDIDAPSPNEIIIGDTTRPESKAITVEGDNYVIKVIGGKVVIKGGSDLATWRGAKTFIDEVKKVKDGNGIAWTDGFTLNGKYDPKEEGTYTLNWNNEFDSSVIDTNKIGASPMIEETETSSLGGFKGWYSYDGTTKYSNPEKIKKLIYQSDGNLNIATQRINEIDFVGGQIGTAKTMAFRYGILEIRSILPPVPCSLGYWLLSTNNGMFSEGGVANFYTTLEVDIIENFGSSTSFSSNIHRWWTIKDYTGAAISGVRGHSSLDGNSKYSGKSKNNKVKEIDVARYGGKDLSQDYHIYTYYWTDSCMKFALDGKVYLDYQYSENSSAPSHCLMTYFITECQMGDASYGATYEPDKHDDYYEHKIDYIRIYQSNSINSQLMTAAPGQTKATVFYPNHVINGRY